MNAFTQWQKLLEQPDLKEMDLVSVTNEGLFRGPLKGLFLNSSGGRFEATTVWTGFYDPVTMQWTKKGSPDGLEHTLVIYCCEQAKLSVTDEFIRIDHSDGTLLGYLVPHSHSKLEFNDLV